MPIHSDLVIEDILDTDFELIDKVVMRCAYATQNKFGHLFDERVYENDLAARLRIEGFDVHTQKALKVYHGDFQKNYQLDLIVNHMIYEIKVVSAFTHEHKAQALNYAMLHNVRRVKLINFGCKMVEGLLLRNAVLNPERYKPDLFKDDMRLLTPCCGLLFGYLNDLIRDWGTHLSVKIYNEALIHLLGGEAHCLKRVQVSSDNQMLGTHLIQTHYQDYAFCVTAFTINQLLYQKHLQTLISSTSLKGIQWINLNRSRIEMTTLIEDEL